jgi:beta-glucosidase
MEWIADVEAVLMAWYPGQEGGHAMASILFGVVSPSGKLPITFPVDAAQLPPFDNESDAVTYGYDHGYRHVDRQGIDPLFPFGFGLSYATFTYDAISLSVATLTDGEKLSVTVDVTNSSARAGAEVVQLYVSYPQLAVERPLVALAAFARVELGPGESASAVLELPARALAYYDPDGRAWTLELGEHTVLVGPSSRDLPLSATFTVR